MTFLAARHAQAQWSATPVADRKAIMLAFHDLVLERQAELLDVIQLETGKARAHAFDEVLDVAVTARHYAFRAARLLRPQRAKGALPLVTSTRVDRGPKGVVGIIAPWNYPLTLAVSDAIPALLAGNAVVLKPDEKTTGTAHLALALLKEAGLPADVMQIIEGGADAGQQVVAECDYLMFTGSTAVGRKLAAQAGQRLIGFSAELGGKNPLIVLPSADIERTARGAVAACFSNAGQLCISIERIYVHDEVADDFIAEFVARTKQLRLGLAWTDDVGHLISPEHLERVAEMVASAVSQGARVLTGGKHEELYYSPTVLIDVPHHADLYTNEVFGPVVYIERVPSVEEAVTRANDSDYGLNASVWGSVREARAVASQLQAGTVNINEGFAATWGSVDAPMGGWKQSGVGRRHADEGLLKFTESRTVAVQRLVQISGPTDLSRQGYAKTLTTALRLGKRLLR
ncbi:MAG: succinic semialdehyde dehydrogenase [Corynebacterium sp.]|uniref:succinic semialdehyde dehydrogenase n=1 Tax=Corynebacterium sp. TaxID=1720 RepID=UPI0026DEEB0B|nr:succinic semialdehyde dehydrogenase [Corynebacterium sp.]MDO5670251.1 succinic semialdehyde dehydrogenase [Corynebacterium sp.]